MLDIEPSLVAAASSGGRDLDALLGAIWPEAYRTAYAILRDRGLAEDSAQDACATIARSLHSLKERTTFRAWAYRIIANAAISTGRRRKADEPLSAVREPAAPDEAAAIVDLEIALAKLPFDQRAVVILHYYVGLTSEEIAGHSGVRASTVRFRLMLARRALYHALRLPESPLEENAQGALHGF